MDTESWRTALERERAEKDEFLAESPESPLPEADRVGFDGLPYYEPDPSLRFELSLITFDGTDEVTVDTTQDGERTYLRWGQFRFTIGGNQYTLTAFRSDPDADRLWIPFKDETNGETTYAAGRYLDLEAENQTADDDWILDFNRA
ncbi:MAG: DUF1684 domain-containing protein, partial [Halobacteriaceae archaeon]